MPVKIPAHLPARQLLEKENIFVMSESRAAHQDIRPLKILILNLMPTKIQTETQLLRLLGNTALQVEITLLHMETHESQNTPAEHLHAFYSTFEEIKNRKFDGLVVTGAPVESLEYEKVDYWKELTSIFSWSEKNVFSSLFICWGAQAGLYYFYDIPKYSLNRKMFGIYDHDVLIPKESIVRGFDETFPAPHSRHTEIRRDDILKRKELILVAESAQAGVYLVASKDGRQIFVTGHPEYDRLTLKNEYDRDLAKGLPIDKPYNYFPHDDPTQTPKVGWKSHAHLLYANWLNYYVYQMTPYDFIG